VVRRWCCRHGEARTKLSADGRWDTLHNELIVLSTELNTASGGGFRAPSDYLITLARKA
jgi:hypothetical protein